MTMKTFGRKIIISIKPTKNKMEDLEMKRSRINICHATPAFS
jgi:hypothetical protein